MARRKDDMERITGYSLAYLYRIAKAHGCSLRRMSLDEIAAMVRKHVAAKELSPRDPRRVRVCPSKRTGERPGRVVRHDDGRLKYLEYNGERRTRSEWAARCGVSLSTMRGRLADLGVAAALARSLEQPGMWPRRWPNKRPANDDASARRGAA